MTRTIFVYRGSQHEKLRIDSLRQGDTIRIYSLNSHDYREYYIACDSWGVKHIVSDKFNIYNFDTFIEALPLFFNNRIIEVI